MPSPFYRSRSPRQQQPTVDDRPLVQAYQQEAQATNANESQAMQMDVIRQEQQKDAAAARQMRDSQAQAAKAQAITVKTAKAQGVETQVDPITAKETIKTRDDGSPVWQPGFTGAPRPADNGHVVDYRDPTGQTFTVPLAKIRRKDEPTGAMYEFDLPGPDGKPQTIRRAEETGKPLFKVDKATGQRFSEAVDPVTGGLVQQPLGMDPVAANAAAIETRKTKWEAEKANRSFAADELRLQQQVIEQQNAPARERLAELERKAKDFETGIRYEETPQGIMRYKNAGDDLPMPPQDETEIVKAKAFLENRRITKAELAKLAAEQEPITKQLQEMELKRRETALSLLRDEHATRLEVAALEDAAKKGAQVWEPESQRRITQAVRSPEYTRAQVEAQAEGTALADDIAAATRNPAMDSIASAMGSLGGMPNDGIGADVEGSALQSTPGELQLAAVLGAAPSAKGGVIDSAKSLGIAKPEEFDLRPGDQPALIHRGTGEELGFVDAKAGRLVLTPAAIYQTEAGRRIARDASAESAPVFVLSGGAPFTPRQRGEFLTAATQAAMANDAAALSAAGADLPGIRRAVKEGKISIQDGKWIAKTIHGVEEPDLTPEGANAELSRFVAASKIEQGMWQGPKATPETRAQVVDRFMDSAAQKAQGSIFYDGIALEDMRTKLKAQHSQQGMIAATADYIGDTAKMLVGSMAGLYASIRGSVMDTVAGAAYNLSELDAAFSGQRPFGPSSAPDSSSRLVADNTSEWFTSAAGLARRSLAAPEMQSALSGVRNWAASADPGDQPPADVVSKLAQVAFTKFHGLSNDADAKARATSADTFDITKDPTLAKHFARYLETRNPADFAALAQLVTLDAKSREIADRVNAYVTRPRAATVADVKDRAAVVLPEITDMQAKILFDASAKPDKGAQARVAAALNLTPEDAALALDLFTGQAAIDQTSLHGYFRSGLQAPIQEAATEAASTALSFGFGKLAARGFVQAAKGATVATTRRAALASWTAAKTASLVDDFAKLGMFSAKLGQPLGRMARVSNAVVSGAKAVTGDMVGEGVEEGVMGAGEAGSTLGSVFESAGAGAMAAPVMVGGMTLLALPMEIRADKRIARDWEAHKVDYLAEVNKRLEAIPGTAPFTPDEFEMALSLYDSNAARADAAAVQAAFDAAAAAGPPTPASLQPVVEAIATAKAREAVAINAAIELREVAEEQRTLFVAATKAAMGVREFTQPELRALMALGGASRVQFTPAPGAVGVNPTGAIDLPGNRQALTQGTIPVVPPELLAQAAQASPALGELLGMAPAPAAPQVSHAPVAGATPVSPTPAGGAPAKLPAELSKAAPRHGNVHIEFKSDVDKAAFITAQDNRSKRDADYLAFAMQATGMTESEVRAHGKKVKAQIKKQVGKMKQGKITLESQPTASQGTAKPAPQPAATPTATPAPTPAPKANTQGVESIARRVIGDITARSPKLKPLITEDKQGGYTDSSGQWKDASQTGGFRFLNGKIFYHMPTLLKQLVGVAPNLVGKRIEALVDEEIRHAAHFEAARRIYNEQMALWTSRRHKAEDVHRFVDWLKNRYGQMWREDFTPEMRLKVEEVYGPNINLLAPWQRAMEGLRMLDQLRATVSITETVLRHLEAVVEFLRDVLTKATPAIQREIDAIQAILVEFGYEQGAVKPEKAKTKPATATKKAKVEAPEAAPESALSNPDMSTGAVDGQASDTKAPTATPAPIKGEGVGNGPRPAEGSIPAVADAENTTPTANVSGASQASLAKIRGAFDGLASAPAPSAQVGLPKERRAVFLDVADSLLADGVNTPVALARALREARPDASLDKFSQAMWDFFGIVETSLRGTHNWTRIYAEIDTPLPEVVEPVVDARTPMEKDPQRVVADRVALGLSGPIGFDIKTLREQASSLSTKEFDEAVEVGITMAAHELVKRGGTPSEIYQRLLSLYERQPKLNAKTSTSKINQAYSTPAPMAYLASVLGDVRNGKVIAEPSAGNGMLLIERQPGQTILANELDPARRDRLDMQGIEATGADATTWTPAQAPDRVIANPPFGQVMEEGGSNKVFQTPMGDTTSIDQAIVLQSLATMLPDGRAVFIIGGPPPTVRSDSARMEYYRKGKAAKFFGHLYSNYNLIDHFTISGDLYEKQGAGWPLDILVIRGAGKSANTLPGLKSPRIINTWEELANELDRTDAERIKLNQLTAEEMRDRVDAMAGKLDGLSGSLRGTQAGVSTPQPAKPARTGDGQTVTGTPEPNLADAPGNAGASTNATATEGVRGGDAPPLGSRDAGATESGVSASDADRGGQLRTGEVTEFQASFPATSGVNPAGLLAPVNLIGPMSEAMARLKEAVGGDLVGYARDKMGYPESADISRYFFGDQIDAIAQAIYTSENGGALVIGDQTGTGKGRIAVGLMKYAVRQGMVPVFVTKNQDLFDAMIDDLKDIEAGEIVPVITNNDIKEKSLKDKLRDLGADSGKAVFQQIATTGELPSGTNVIFTTYDQIKGDDAPGLTPRDRARFKRDMEAPPGSWRMDALRRVAPNAMFILDESHLAGGQSTTGWRFGELLRSAKNVYYSSATFAKRPDNMGIYFRTNLGRVGGDINGLIGLMQAGGVPAMQIGSSMLAQDGQYMRRERSFDGVSFRTHINQSSYERDKELADNYTEGLRAIISVQERMGQAAEAINTILNAFGKSANIPMGNRARLESSNFSAKLHNLVRQYLLAIKANSAAVLAVQAIKEGVKGADGTVKRHKVIVAVENTMESVIENLQAQGMPLTFNGVLQMYLEQMKSIKVSGGAYGREAKYFTIKETPPEEFTNTDDQQLRRLLVVQSRNPETGEPAYEVNQDVANEMIRRAMVGIFTEARSVIQDINLADMPISPIDAMRQAVEREGIRTGEMTGRTTGIDRNGQPYQRSAAEVRGKLQAKDEFNNADLDFLVINKSGSTGVSMHASEKFKDKRPRLMMIVQANLDINEFMQTIGRIHRAGQVELPSYISLQTALPAENRPAAILGRKMSMLNANTTSNADSELSQAEIADIFNQYGDEVVHGYLARNPGLVRLVSQSWEKLTEDGNLRSLSDFLDEETGGHGYLARSVTGHLAILPVDEQEAFWETVTADYKGMIDYLDQIGKNELRASALDMKAETVSSVEFTPGTEDGSVFARPSFVETVNAKMGKRPLEVDQALTTANAAREKASQRQDAFLDTANAFIDAEEKRKEAASRNWDERRQDWINGQQEQRDTISNAVGQIGSFGTYERDDGSEGYAFIEDVQLNTEKPNTPSAQFAIVRVNDSQDRLKLPVSQVAQFFKPATMSDFNRERIARQGWERSWSFGTQQAIVTGNLLAALQEIAARGLKPRVISYTKNDVSQQMGILLSQSAAILINQSSQTFAPVTDATAMLDLVKAGYTIQNMAGSVRLAGSDGTYYLYVPSARTTGGKYWRDPGLLRITGEFVDGQGNVFVANMDGDGLKRAFDYLIANQGERFTRPVAAGGLSSAPAPRRDDTKLKEALQKMPEIWRKVLEAKMRGDAIPDIATANSISEVAVGNVLRVAEGRLRTLLAQASAIKPTVRVEGEAVKAASGRPDLSMSGNAPFIAVDQQRTIQEVTHAEMNELAGQMFAEAPEAAEAFVVRWMDSGTTNMRTDDQPPAIQRAVAEAQARMAAEMLMTAAAKLLVTDRAMKGGDAVQTARLIELYRNTGTEQARALGMRQDPFLTPAERAAMYIAEALLTPPESMRNDMRRNPANKERILAEWARKSDQLKADLKAAGMDIDATFAALRREKEAAERAIPVEIKTPLARANTRTQKLVRSVLEGKTWREAADTAKMTLEQARKAYNAFRAQVNETGAQAAQAARDALLRSAPAPGADFAAQIGLPEWTEEASPDAAPVKTETTEALKKERTRKKSAGEIDLKNPVDVARVETRLSTFKSSTFDKFSEFWRASILSGPQTQVVNISSGLAFGIYETGFKKLGTAALADAARLFGMKPDAASLADIPAMVAATKPAIAAAFRDSLRAWKAETSFFDAYAKDHRDESGMFKGESFNPSLKGPVGTVMRSISFRLMLLADEFVKSFFTRIEVAAKAREIARSEGLKGEAMANRIAELLTPGSIAWVRSLDSSLKITFQTPLKTNNGIVDQIDGLAEMIQNTKKGKYGWLLKGVTHFVFPFVSTPTNIFKMGVQMSPLGTFTALIDAGRSLNESRKGNTEEAARLYNAARLFDDMVNQIVAWGVLMAVSDLVMPGDDEDELPFITGTMSWKATREGERQLAYRTAPPMSIRIGGRWWSYGRLDPFATSLAFVVDTVKEFNKGAPLDETWGKIGVQMITTMQDKTFLQGFSDLMNAIEQPERFGTRWATNIVTGFVPNLIRQPIRSADENIRENDLPNDMGFMEAMRTRVGYSIIPQAAPPAIDVWGRPEVKGTNTGSPQTDFMLRLFSPAQSRGLGPDPLDVAILRYNLTADKPIAITAPDRELRRTAGKQVIKASLTDDEWGQLASAAGRTARMMIGQRFNGRNLTDDDAEFIRDVVKRAHDVHRETWKRKKLVVSSSTP